MISYSQEKLDIFFNRCRNQYAEISTLVESSFPNLELFSDFLGPEKSFLLKNLLQGVTKRSAGLLVAADDSMQKIGLVRFLFESLILARLIMTEVDFAKKTYYSSFAQHYDKKKIIVNQISEEILLLKDYIDREETLFSELEREMSAGHEEALTRHQEKDRDLVLKLLGELTAFTDDAAEWGFEHHLDNLKEMHEAYIDDKNELRINLMEAIEKLGGNFDKDDSNELLAQVLTRLTRDGRTWERKAADAGLSKEYNFIYRYSSGLLHGGTYAYFTPHGLTQEENVMVTRLGLKYFKEIVETIRSQSPIFNVRVVNIGSS